MKFRYFLFPLLMVFLTSLTIFKYIEIKEFKKQSEEFSFVIDVDSEKLNSFRSDLQNLTYQDVQIEEAEEGKHYLIVRCPPDKIGMVLSIIKKFGK